MPGFHKSVLADGNEDRMVLNIGGIADITIQPADPSRAVTGFDTGHGNTVVDQWAHRYQGTVMDVDGRPGWARQTITCCNSCLRSLFGKPPPRSTGRVHFNRSWLTATSATHGHNAADVQATLCELTARSIADADGRYAAGSRRLLVCGGGVHNSRLLELLTAALPGFEVRSTADEGIDPDWVEAVSFVWLARQHLQARPAIFPSSAVPAVRSFSAGASSPAQAAEMPTVQRSLIGLYGLGSWPV